MKDYTGIAAAWRRLRDHISREERRGTIGITEAMELRENLLTLAEGTLEEGTFTREQREVLA